MENVNVGNIIKLNGLSIKCCQFAFNRLISTLWIKILRSKNAKVITLIGGTG